NEASFFILSSRFEGFGLVLLEAQSYGLPVISFDCEMGPSEIIKHNETGWLCENGNIYALSNAIEHAININEKDYQTYQNASIINSS
ncbi:TPA: glycosyltransferase, partial [Morganella morganii]|nr:glycosyltransferase [Morganella morganii]